jgi:AcrR family transcriptional regulator
MPRKAPASTDTAKRALMKAAAEVFAEDGYQLARVRRIAARAGVNVAAVNYHFGSKEGLYIAVLKDLMRTNMARFPLPEEGEEPDDPDQRFEQAVGSLLRRFASPDRPALLGELMVRELANPTPALDRLVAELARPQFQKLKQIVAEFLGPRASEREVVAATFSVAGQCVFYLLARPIIARFHAAAQPRNEREVAWLAAHIARFSLAGLKATRRAIEGTKRS